MRQGRLAAFLATIVAVAAVEIPLRVGGNVCTALMSSFDPIKLDIRFPAVKPTLDSANFSLTVTSLADSQIVYETSLPPNSTLRTSIALTQNVLHQLCISYLEDVGSESEETLYIPFVQAEDFAGLIGNIDVPAELAKEDNLKAIYTTAKKLEGVGKVIAAHQAKERALEDEIVAKNIHKTQRILTLSFLECLVIVLSGVYQLCALRKFLIEKNLY